MHNLSAFIKAQGYDFTPDTINGKFQKVSDASGHKLWYIGRDHGEDFLTFTFGDFREPDKRFSFISRENLTDADKENLAKFQKRIEKDKTLKQEVAKEIVNTLLSQWQKEPGEKPEYLLTKNMPMPPDCLSRQAPESRQNVLVIPMRDLSGEIWNIQQIWAGGNKTFWPKARVKGSFYIFGEIKPDQTIYIGEGWATCHAVYLTTGLPVVCAFNISNLEEAIKRLHLEMRVPINQMVLLADWDGKTFKKTGKNPGMLAVQKLTSKYKCGFVMPGSWPAEINLDFADAYKNLEQDAFKDLLKRVLYFADIADEVYDVSQKNDDIIQTPTIEDNIMSESMFEKIGPVHEMPLPLVKVPFEVPNLEVKRVGDPWTPIKHNIATRQSGFHIIEVGKKGGIKYIPSYTDLRLAFEELHPFVSHRVSEVVYAFNGKVYEFVSELDMASFVDKNFDPPAKNTDCREFQGAISRYNVVSEEFFKSERKINFQNGWLDLETFEFHTHTPKIGFKTILNYSFDENALCPQFDAFLTRVMSGDETLSQMVLEYLGYILSGDECWAQKAMVLKGEGSNGKTTFLRMVRELIGIQNICASKISDFKSEYTRQTLDGKLANIAEETPKDSLLETSSFKDIVAGGTLQVRAPYGHSYDLAVRAKLLFSCNDMPASGDSSHALFRRLLIVPFEQIFSEKDADPFMDKKLLTELPGIFNRVLQAYLTLVKRGRFEISQKSIEAVQEFKISNDPLLQWVEGNILLVDPGHPAFEEVTPTEVLYRSFASWSEAMGYQKRTIDWFGKHMARAIGRDRFTRKRTGLCKKRGLRGVLKSDGSPWKEQF